MAFIGTLRLSFSAHSKNQNGQKNGDHSGGSLRQELVCDLAVYRAIAVQHSSVLLQRPELEGKYKQ